MSSIDKSFVHVMAEAAGVSNLPNDLADGLASDVEYRLRALIQDASKFMRHSRRSKLTTEDINGALKLANVEPLYGYSSMEPLKFCRANGAPDLYFLEDKEHDFNEIMTGSLPKVPRETTFTAHWLAVQGVQPAIPQNAPIDDRNKAKRKKLGKEEDKKVGAQGGQATEVKPLVEHVLPKELQIYYDKITASVKGSKEEVRRQALASVAGNAGLSQLVPYFCQFISDEVNRNLRNLYLLSSMMRLVRALLDNSSIQIEHYLHQLMPSILTCLVGRRLCEKPTENHWALRDRAAALVSVVCRRYGSAYTTLQPRVTKTLLAAFLDPSRPLTTHYGSIVGLIALGSNVVKLLVLPNLVVYMKMLEPELENENALKRYEAEKCKSALLRSVGDFIRSEYFPSMQKLYKATPSSSRVPMSNKKLKIPKKSKSSGMDIDREVNGTDKAALPDLSAQLLPSVDIDLKQVMKIFGEELIPYSSSSMEFL